MTYLDKIKQVKDSTQAQKIIFDVMSIAKDKAFDMWLAEKETATALRDWFGPAMIKVLDMEVLHE